MSPQRDLWNILHPLSLLSPSCEVRTIACNDHRVPPCHTEAKELSNHRLRLPKPKSTFSYPRLTVSGVCQSRGSRLTPAAAHRVTWPPGSEAFLELIILGQIINPPSSSPDGIVAHAEAELGYIVGS